MRWHHGQKTTSDQNSYYWDSDLEQLYVIFGFLSAKGSGKLNVVAQPESRLNVS
jgi:hypothetical protein